MKRLYTLAFGLIIFISGYSQAGPCQDLFFSEYIEGSSSNKAFEIYNPTSSDIDLTDYVVYRANNGSLTPTDSIFPQGMIAAGDVFVIANPSANAGIMAEMDTLHTLTFYNGDDAVWIQKISTGEMLDLIGEIGVDPGSGWPVDTGATNNFTLVRKIEIQQGSTDWAIGATEWDVFVIDEISNLGAHDIMPCGAIAPCSDLFFSEYIEGSSSNKAFEIYNPTSSDIDLTDYVVYRANNGSLTPTDSIFPQGMIAAGDVFVVANPSANAGIMAEMDTLHTLTFYNGDDAVWIQKISTGEMLDLIGEIGVDPGSGWPVGTGATNNFTLVRKIDIQQGSTDWAIGATEWDVFAIDDISNLGAHDIMPCGGIAPCSELFFSEIIEGSSSNKAIEVYNPTGSTVDLTNYQILRFNNGASSPSGTFNFPAGAMLLDGDVWVSVNGSADAALIAIADEDTSSVTFFNGDDAMVLMNIITGDTLDIIGVVGVDPGSGWPVGTGATNNNTLVRMSSVQNGTTDWSVGATQWDVFPIDDFTHAGSHTMNPCGASSPFIGFTSSALAVEEDAGTLSIEVGLTNSDGNAVDVNVSLGAGGNATDVSDFTHTLPTTLSYTGATDEVMTFDVDIVDDALVEGEETIQLVLSMATGGAELTTDTLMITIAASDMVIPTYPIGDINNVDVDGVSDSLGVECKVIGLVYGVDLQGGDAIQFTMHDGTGGIGVFSSDSLGYSVLEGDEIRLIGTISQFNGLTQMNPDSIVLLSQGNALPDPTVITVQDESTESELVTIECVTIDDPADWNPGGSGFNVDVSNANGTYVLRIDSDTDVSGLAAPTGVFTVTGIGGQFDSSIPHDEGYQLLPRYIADINENDPGCVSQVEEIAGIQVKAFPNPGNGILTIETAISIERIRIFNALGQEVNFSSEQSQGKVNINMHGSDAGIYQVFVQTEQGNSTLQYVITK